MIGVNLATIASLKRKYYQDMINPKSVRSLFDDNEDDENTIVFNNNQDGTTINIRGQIRKIEAVKAIS